MVPQRMPLWAALALLTSPVWAGLDGQQVCSVGQTSCLVVGSHAGCGGCPVPDPGSDCSLSCSVSCTSVGQDRTGVGCVQAEGGQCAVGCSVHASAQDKDIHCRPCPCYDLCTYAYLFTSQVVYAQCSQMQLCQRSCAGGSHVASVHVTNAMSVVHGQTTGYR